MRVLVVDDRADNLYLLRSLLQGHGYEVDEARHGAEALAKAHQHRPDLVVSDLLMPVMDGYTLLRRWKADEALREVPFVVYTATYTDPKDEQLALEMGADAFIVKPAEPDAFLQRIHTVLEATRAGMLAPVRTPDATPDESLEAYSAALVRKLEQRALQLEQRVAEREQALRDLALSEARYRALFEHSLDLILLTSPDGSVQSANPAACRAFGMSEAQICATGRDGLVDRADPNLARLLAQREATGYACGELTMIRADGTRFAAEVSSTIYRDGEGVARSGMFIRDLSERKAAEAALKASNTRLADLQAAVDAHALLSITDLAGRITFVNDYFCAVSGYAREELLGQTHRILNSGVHPRSFFDDMWSTLQRGQVWEGEICSRAKDGHLFWVDSTLAPSLDDAGRPYQFIGIRTDISVRKRAEELRRELEAQLRQSQKLQAVGTLAGGIAHDFNNIVAAILGYAALARQDLPEGGKAHEWLAQIQAAGERARAVVQRILAFSRPQPALLANLPLQPLIIETEAILRGSLPAVATIEARLPEAPLHALVDATQFEQVLLNLCTNAWHALGGSTGRIEIGLDAVEIDAAVTDRLADLPAGAYAHLWVRDDGCGMDEATRARIFEPFFTTKRTGQGTGLGLAVVRGIIESHHGAMAVDSEPGRGSTFHVYLPRVAPELGAAAAVQASAPVVVTGSRRRVLFLDDDEVISLLGERMLSRAGCSVTCFNDPRQALAAVRAHAHDHDLVVTDFNMPGLSGLEVARELRSIRSDLPVILASGYIDDALRAQAAQLGVRALLNKERMAEDLALVVQRTLAGLPAAS